MNSEVARFQFASVQLMLDALRPDEPMFCFYPARLESAARRFLCSFPGHVLFAVKANPAGHILHGLHSAGIKNYDVASVKEIQAVANFPGACLYFMHPVKARSMIAAAYTQYGVKHFSVDTIYELAKVREETRKASDVTVHVRCEVPNTESLYPLDKKFGATTAQAIEIVRCAKDYYREVGLCFHVGSQCMDPAAFRKALGIMGQLARQSAVKIGYINVGGGFPSQYPGMEPPDLQSFMEAIRAGVAENEEFREAQVLCEPGRALVAESESLIAKVLLRKNNVLYINDGGYGVLFDACHFKFRYPTRAYSLGNEKRFSGETQEFAFYGATCDSIDFMKGPFVLPSNIEEGDYIEIGTLGGYGSAMRSQFNGFYAEKVARIV